MPDQYAAPIDHTTGSAVASTAAGAAGGALKSGVKAGIGWFAGLTALGAVIGLAFATGGSSLIGSWFLWGPVIGAGAGAIIAGTSWTPIAAIGALFGGAKGGANAAREVKAERGSAAVLQAQVAAYKAQAMAQSNAATTNVYATSATNDNKFGFAPQGSEMNQAMPNGLQNMQYQGAIASSPELAAGMH